MIQIILLFAASYALMRLPQVKRRSVANYPGVSAEKFKLWHEADLKATIAFVIATWGALVLQIAIIIAGAYAKQQFSRSEQDIEMAMVAGILATFLLPLVWPAILGTKAARLKKEAGISREMEAATEEKTKPKVTGLAISGLICSILGIMPVWGIVFIAIGLILSFVALHKINRSPGEIRGRGVIIAAFIVGGLLLFGQILLLSHFAMMKAKTKITETVQKINVVKIAIALYHIDTGNYPQDLSILVSGSAERGPYLKELPKDAWGRGYIYRLESSESYELFSSGPDGIEGTKDDVKSND